MKKFWKDESGSYVVMMGLLIVPILLSVGMAVDYTLAVLNQKQLQAVLDAAVLAGTEQARLGTQVQVPQDVAKAYFAGNIVGKLTGGGPPPTPTFTVQGLRVSGSALYEVPASFMRLVGVDKIPVQAKAAATWKTPALELALVLDVSSSMLTNGKLAGVRDAANALLDRLYGKGGTVRNGAFVSIAPFDGRVNVSTYDKAWIDPSLAVGPAGTAFDDKCVGLRSTANIISDATPAQEMFPPFAYRGSEIACHALKAIGPSADISLIRSAIGSLDNPAGNGAGQGTAIWEGAVWGFRMLSPNWQGLWGTPNLPLAYPANGEPRQKVAVIMTDGGNDPSWYGDPLSETQAAAMTVQVCRLMRANGIIVYAVAFDDPYPTMLQQCASDAAHFFTAAANGLPAVFATIGQQLASGSVRLLY